MRVTWIAPATLLVAAISWTSAMAAPVFLQDYEGGLVEPFNFQPDHSGSTRGILNNADPHAAGTSTIALNTADGALGTAQSATLDIVDDAATAGSPAGTAYSIRFVPNNAAGASAANPAFATDGYVGFYLKTDPSAASALLEVAPLLEDSGGTLAGSGGVLRSVISDGLWHLYEWNMDDPNDFPNTFESFYGGTPAAETLDATANFDSIAIISRGVEGQSSAVLHIDQIGYNNAGRLPQPIPEPTTIALLALGCVGALGFVRRRQIG